uniref:Uncharacterized protein n=1 Tax=Brassica oleracea var. oleracea TaxID=109376 RepID=A0A0D3DL75_BRAOL
MHGFVSYRRFGKVRSLRSDRAVYVLGRYIATELGWSLVATGLLALLKVERDKIGAAPYDGCLRTLVEGIKPFVVRLGVKVLMTSFPARPLRSSLFVEVIKYVAANGILYRVFDTMPRDVRDQCDGFRARPRSNHDFRGCDDYFDLRFPYHFKLRDMFSAYLTCMPLSDGAMVSQIVWLGVKDVFTQIAKDVVGRGLGHGTLTFKVIRSLRGLIQNQCGVSCGTIACSDVTEGNETQKPRIIGSSRSISEAEVSQTAFGGGFKLRLYFTRYLQRKAWSCGGAVTWISLGFGFQGLALSMSKEQRILFMGQQRGWRHIDEQTKDTMWEEVQAMFNLTEDWQKTSVFQQIGCVFRASKSRLVKKLCSSMNTETLRSLKPSNIHNEAVWINDQFRDMRMRQIPHTTSRKGMGRLADEMTKKASGRVRLLEARSG